MVLIVAEKKGPHGVLLVVTDKDILGKIFSEGNVQLDLTKQFYEGKERSAEEIAQLFGKARDIHFTGKEAVALGVEKDLIDSDRILYVEGVPHAEVAIGD